MKGSRDELHRSKDTHAKLEIELMASLEKLKALEANSTSLQVDYEKIVAELDELKITPPVNNAAELAFKELQAERRQLRKELDDTKFQLEIANEAARVTRNAAWPSADDMDVCSNKVYSCNSELETCKTDKRTLAIELSQISYAMDDVTGTTHCINSTFATNMSAPIIALLICTISYLPHFSAFLCPTITYSKRQATNAPLI